MPLDSSIYPLGGLRLDGRRWNELRSLHGLVSTQPGSADGSSYLEMGNTKVLCIITGPVELKNQGQNRREGSEREQAAVAVDVNLAGFAGVDRKKRGRSDRRINELQRIISSTMSTTIFLNLYPHSTVSIMLHVLALDGSLTAACINAATLALVDAGIPMRDYIAACSCGLSPLPSALHSTGKGRIPTRSSAAQSGMNTGALVNGDENLQDPLLDLNGPEEQELAFLTVATLGAGDRIVAMNMDSKVRVDKLESMLVTAVDGCRMIRGLLDQIIHENGARIVAQGGVK